jgi:ABC-type Fe3+ transport system permease subunit
MSLSPTSNPIGFEPFTIALGLAAGALFAFMVSFDNFPISLCLADAQHNPIPLPVFRTWLHASCPPQAAKSCATRPPNLHPPD